MTNNGDLTSIDVFDTALFRIVYAPTDVFKLVESKVGNDFYRKRIDAENKARMNYPFYNIQDIYKFLPEFKISDEIKTEFISCVPNHSILKMYNRNPERYIFISDMYLSSKTIAELLENCGYKNPRVFVSCEEGCSKGGGHLFKKVQRKIGCKIVDHYGDNYVGDIEGAREAGIEKVIFHPALHNLSLNLPAIQDPVLKKIVALWDSKPAEEKIALYQVPLITEFTKWVLKKRKPGQKIFFLSRDMYMPYKLATEELGAEDVFYLHVSRRSIASACFRSDNRNLQDRIKVLSSVVGINGQSSQGTEELVTYLSQYNIKDGDIIADIGYIGTIQAGIDSVLGIKTRGLYMQLDSNKLKDIQAEMFLSRPAIYYCLLVEAALGSDEDCVFGYRNGEVVFVPENEQKKELARKMTKTCMEASKLLVKQNINVHDVEQLLIHLQFYPSDDILEVFNQPIFSNREIAESVIWFDREAIMNGRLRECYRNSYAKPLFKRLLEADKELKYLSRLLG